MPNREEWKPEIQEVNYDAGRSMSTYAPFDLRMQDFPRPFINGIFFNVRLVEMRIVQTVRVINKKFEYCLAVYKDIMNQGGTILDHPEPGFLVLNPSSVHEYKIECESIIFQMRRVLDSLVQLTSILVDPHRFDKRKIVHFDSVGKIIHKGKEAGEVGKIILGDGFYLEDSSNFIEITNDLFNGYKHTLINDEAFGLVGEELMTMVGYSVKHSNYNQVIQYHNHNSYHIMMGFEDCVRRVLVNQNKYLEKSCKADL